MDGDTLHKHTAGMAWFFVVEPMVEHGTPTIQMHASKPCARMRVPPPHEQAAGWSAVPSDSVMREQ